MKSLAIVLGILAAVGCTPPPPRPPESVPSYAVDFASGAPGCTLNNYQGRTAFAVVTNGVRAVFCVARTSEPTPETKDTSWGLRTGAFPVTPGREYAVRFEMSGHLPKAAHIRPGASIEWLDSAGKPIVGVDALGKDVALSAPLAFPLRKPDTGLSRTVSKGFVPAGAVSARIFFGVDHPDLGKDEKVCVHGISYFEHESGASWFFDDVDAPELHVLTPSPTADLFAPIRFRLTDATGVDETRVSCAVNGKRVSLADLNRDGDVFTYVPVKPWPAESVVRIEVACADVNGYEAVEWGFVAVTSTKTRHAKWAVRDDGVLLKDGTPFFPLGLTNIHAAEWCGGDLDRGLGELKANGMNFAHTYMVRGRKNHAMSRRYGDLVAAAEKHGLAFLPEPAVRFGTREARDGMAAANMLSGRASAAQCGWGIGDDTSRLQSPRDLKRLYRFCKAVDADLLTFSVDATCSASQQAPYVPFADVLVLEDYPIRKAVPQDDEMAVFAETIDNGWEATRLAGIGNRSVMSMPQAFRGFRSWLRYPTEAELRCQAYLSLACRARGIIAYTSFSYDGNEGAFNRPETRAEFEALMREVSALLPSLVLRDSAEQPQVTVTEGPERNVRGGDSVRCLLKADGLLVLANSSHRAVKAKIRLPSGAELVRELPRNAGWAERVPRDVTSRMKPCRQFPQESEEAARFATSGTHIREMER